MTFDLSTFIIDSSGFRHRDNGFWIGRSVAKSTVRPIRVLVITALLDDDLGFLGAIEYFSVEQLITEPCIDAVDSSFATIYSGL